MVGGLWFGSRGWRSSLATRYAVAAGRRGGVHGAAHRGPLPRGRRCVQPAGRSHHRAGVLLPVRARRACGAPGAETEAFTWVASALVAGIAAGSALGGALVAADGVSAPFVLSCAVTALAAVLAVLAVRASPAGPARLAFRHGGGQSPAGPVATLWQRWTISTAKTSSITTSTRTTGLRPSPRSREPTSSSTTSTRCAETS